MKLGARNQNFPVLNEEEVEIETNTGMLVKNMAVFNRKGFLILNEIQILKFEIQNFLCTGMLLESMAVLAI